MTPDNYLEYCVVMLKKQKYPFTPLHGLLRNVYRLHKLKSKINKRGTWYNALGWLELKYLCFPLVCNYLDKIDQPEF